MVSVAVSLRLSSRRPIRPATRELTASRLAGPRMTYGTLACRSPEWRSSAGSPAAVAGRPPPAHGGAWRRMTTPGSLRGLSPATSVLWAGDQRYAGCGFVAMITTQGGTVASSVSQAGGSRGRG